MVTLPSTPKLPKDLTPGICDSSVWRKSYNSNTHKAIHLDVFWQFNLSLVCLIIFEAFHNGRFHIIGLLLLSP